MAIADGLHFSRLSNAAPFLCYHAPKRIMQSNISLLPLVLQMSDSGSRYAHANAGEQTCLGQIVLTT